MSELKKIKVGAWEWSEWPTLPLPDEAWLIAYAQRKGGAHAIDAFHRQREVSIEQERHDPLTYGWEQPVFAVLRALLKGEYTPGMIGAAVAGNGLSGNNGNQAWRQKETANDVVCLGGNGSGKTEIQAKIAMEVLETRDGSEARCFSQNEQTSIQYIQKAMFRYLRPELRKVKKQGIVTKISYSQATGFSEGKLILPKGSTCLYPTYKAYQQDPNSVEGGECHVLTWDEEAPAELIITARFRVHKTGGFILGGFTPVRGYSETVGQYIEGGRILECIPARRVVWDWWQRTWGWGEWLLPPERILVKGCPPGHVPLVIESGQGSGRRFAVVCPTMFNPYTDVASIIGSFGTARLEERLELKLERLWGWPTKKARPSFPTFGDAHIVKRDRLPKLEELTIYHWADPHGDRNWFMLWLGVDKDGRKWVLKEWPDRDMGEWALPGSKPDGKMGPAQTLGHGKSFNDYKRLILEAEGWAPSATGVWRPVAESQISDDKFQSASARPPGKGEPRPDVWTVRDRRLDPRPAGTSVPSDEEARTFLDHLNDAIVSPDGTELVPGLDFAAGPDCGIEEGKQWVNNFLTEGWNPEQPITPLNCPKFYVLDECENLIWALKTWTGADGLKGACKDPIDCLKGLGKMGVEHLPVGALGSYGGGSY